MACWFRFCLDSSPIYCWRFIARKPMASGYLSAEFDNSASKSRTRHANFPGIRRHNRAARENGKEEKDEKFLQVPNRTMMDCHPTSAQGSQFEIPHIRSG